MTRRFEHHARTVSVLTFASRLTGLARDASLSRVFGAGPLMDAFFFAFMIPNLFRRLFGEGALSAAFLPEYTRLVRDDPPAARALATLTLAWLVVALGAIVLVAEVALFAIAAASESPGPALRLTMIMLPYMPLICVVAVLGAMLQVHHRFGPTAAAPIVLNACVIAAAAGGPLLFPEFVDDERHIALVAAAVVTAGVLQVIWSYVALRGTKWWNPDLGTGRAPVRRVLGQAGPMILGLGVLQLNTLVDGAIASWPTAVGPTIAGIDYPLEPGAMAAISFAQRLYQFPLGVFGIAVATAIFPALSRAADDSASFTDIVRRGLRLVVFIGLPASCGLVLVREPLAAVILEGGDFTREDTARVGFVLLGYAPAVWAYSMMHVLTRAFYARGESLTPVRVAIAMVALNLVLNCTLIWTPLGVAGLAWSTAICAVLQAVVLLRLLHRRIGQVTDRHVAKSWTRSLGAAAGMTVAVLAAGAALPDGNTWTTSLVRLAGMVAAGGAVYAAVAVILRMPELRWLIGGGKEQA